MSLVSLAVSSAQRTTALCFLADRGSRPQRGRAARAHLQFHWTSLRDWLTNSKPFPGNYNFIRLWGTGMHTPTYASGLRENFCRSLAATAVAFVCLLAPASGQSVKVLKLGYILSTDSQLGAGGAVFADEIAKRMQGRYRIDQYPNSALGGEVEMLKAVKLGTVDMAFITGAPLPNIMPGIGVFNIPFLFRNVAHAHAVLDGSIGQSYLEKVSRRRGPVGCLGVGQWNAAHNQFQT